MKKDYLKTPRGKELRKLEEEARIKRSGAQVEAGKVGMLQIRQGLGGHVKGSTLYSKKVGSY